MTSTAIPSLARVPPLNIRIDIAPPEWEACLEAWLSLTFAYLRLDDGHFVPKATDDGSVVPFLTSFTKEASLASANTEDMQFESSSAQKLKRAIALLSHRAISTAKPVPKSLLDVDFLINLANACHGDPAVRTSVNLVWQKHGEDLHESLQSWKSAVISSLEKEGADNISKPLKRATYLVSICPQFGAFLMIGSDFLDSLIAGYAKSTEQVRAKIVATTHLCLVSLLRGQKPQYSLLSDHLYSMKDQCKPGQRSLLADLVTNTPLLQRISESTSPEQGNRARILATSLNSYEMPELKRSRRSRVDKGKQKAQFTGESTEQHFHKMGLVTQVQDLFPDLGSGFVMKLLSAYNDSVEGATAALLEDNLPPHLQNADRAEQISEVTSAEHRPHLSPRSTPPLPERRNVFDNDEFDRLVVDTSRLHFGRKERPTADNLLSKPSDASSKAAILSALAAFDSDDDERDDTYDVEDVGGTVDAGQPSGEEADADLRSSNEEALMKAFNEIPALFERDAATRRSQPRSALKEQTGMTDEAIEGWAVMIRRDPRRLRKLEARYSTFTGQQNELAPTAYRDTGATSGEDTEGDGSRGNGRGRARGFGGGRGRGRGRGRGGGGGGSGNASGQDQTGGDSRGRARKEANKSSRANHNRRDQRARKMARGGLPG